jgi:hypothetical protein
VEFIVKTNIDISRDELGANLKAICGNIFGALILRESLVQSQSFPPLNPQIYGVFYCFMRKVYKIGSTVGSKIKLCCDDLSDLYPETSNISS